MPAWLKVEEIKPIPLSPCDRIYAHAASTVKELLGKPIPGFAFHYKEYGIEFLIADEDRADLGERILSRVADQEFTDRVVSEGLKACDELLKLSEPFARSRDFSDSELADRFEAYLAVLGKSMGCGYLGNLLDYASDDVDNVLVARLEKTVSARVPNRREALDVLLALSAPEDITFPAQEHRDFLALAVDVLADPKARTFLAEKKADDFRKAFPDLAARVSAHREKWAWLSFLFVGPVTWTDAYFYGLLADEAKKGGAKKELARLEKQPAAILAARKKAERLVPDDAFFYAARKLSYLKAMRKDAQVHSYYYLDGFYKHLARRFGLSPTQARFHTSDELLAILCGTQKPDAARANRRFKECVFFTYHGKSGVLEGPVVDAFLKNVRRPVVAQADSVTGSCACPGFARGTVRIVNTAAEAEKVREGDILVSYATNPELVSAMRKSAAIVTDMGGLTCHAAIVARELGKPCVIGTKTATSAFKDGDVVEVDADKGSVKKVA